MFPVYQLADIAKRKLGRSLTYDKFRKVGDKKVVRKLLNAPYWQLGALPAERAREFPVVAVLLVCAFGHHVVVDALFAKCVEAVEAFGVLVALEADLAGEELFVDLLGKLAAARRRRHRRYTFECARVNRRCVVPLPVLSPSKPEEEEEK